jgi:hypothetical protein
MARRSKPRLNPAWSILHAEALTAGRPEVQSEAPLVECLGLIR